MADYFVFMAYDQYSANSKKAGTTAGYNWVETNVKKLIDREEVNADKIILGIPFYTRLWQEKNGKLSSKTVDMKEVQTVLPRNVQKVWNEELKQNYVEYTKNNTVYKMWIEDEESIRKKIELVRQYNLAGIASWEKDRETASVWKVISEGLKN